MNEHSGKEVTEARQIREIRKPHLLLASHSDDDIELHKRARTPNKRRRPLPSGRRRDHLLGGSAAGQRKADRPWPILFANGGSRPRRSEGKTPDAPQLDSALTNRFTPAAAVRAHHSPYKPCGRPFLTCYTHVSLLCLKVRYQELQFERAGPISNPGPEPHRSAAKNRASVRASNVVKTQVRINGSAIALGACNSSLLPSFITIKHTTKHEIRTKEQPKEVNRNSTPHHLIPR
ncbi:hypothetical protein PSPO01_13312 [Paraphaeosphaeria sporulosa]